MSRYANCIIYCQSIDTRKVHVRRATSVWPKHCRLDRGVSSMVQQATNSRNNEDASSVVQCKSSDVHPSFPHIEQFPCWWFLITPPVDLREKSRKTQLKGIQMPAIALNPRLRTSLFDFYEVAEKCASHTILSRRNFKKNFSHFTCFDSIRGLPLAIGTLPTYLLMYVSNSSQINRINRFLWDTFFSSGC